MSDPKETPYLRRLRLLVEAKLSFHHGEETDAEFMSCFIGRFLAYFGESLLASDDLLTEQRIRRNNPDETYCWD